MKRLLLAGLMALTAFAGAGDDLKTWFVFFMKGDGPRPSDQKELQAMQDGHLANLEAIVKNFHGLAAGPLQDPTKERRGIVVLQAKDEAEVMHAFDNDPFVKAKLLSPRAMQWKADPTVFKTAQASRGEFSDFRVVVFRPGKALRPVNDAIMKEHREFLAGLKSSHNLRATGEIQSPYKIREIAIFESKDEEGIRKTLGEDPLVKTSLLEFEIIPLWMGKGIFGS